MSHEFGVQHESLRNVHSLAFDGGLKFLDEEDINGDRAAFCGYPGSGCSLLRKYFEMVTGVTTGSDISLFFSLPG